MLKILRLILRVPRPVIQREMALRLAEEFFKREGIRVNEPKPVEEMRSWLIWADSNIIPSAWVRIDNQEGKILNSGIPLR